MQYYRCHTVVLIGGKHYAPYTTFRLLQSQQSASALNTCQVDGSGQAADRHRRQDLRIVLLIQANNSSVQMRSRDHCLAYKTENYGLDIALLTLQYLSTLQQNLTEKKHYNTLMKHGKTESWNKDMGNRTGT